MTKCNFDSALLRVMSEYTAALNSTPPLIRSFMAHLAQTRGKFIRAKSLLACAQDKEGLICENAVRLAVAVEILHLATLVHDDVIDNARVRRGMATLHKKFGAKTAVICGDYLFCLSLKIASKVENREDYIALDVPDYMSRICLGELLQHMNNKNYDISEYRYFKIIAGKTAALFEAAFHAGAVLSGCEKPEIKKYMNLGRYTGMIFQLIDDCMDYEKSEKFAKKTVRSDFEQGVITLPLIYAFKEMPELKARIKSEGSSKEEINALVAKAGGLEYTHKVAGKYYLKAKKIIDFLTLAEEKKRNLLNILDTAYGRTYD